MRPTIKIGSLKCHLRGADFRKTEVSDLNTTLLTAHEFHFQQLRPGVYVMKIHRTSLELVSS